MKSVDSSRVLVQPPVKFNYSINLSKNVSSVVGDYYRIAQILTNFLSNAIKFTNAGEVELTVNEGKQKGDNVEFLFAVRDTGIGMDEETVSKLFTPFSQVLSSHLH